MINWENYSQGLTTLLAPPDTIQTTSNHGRKGAFNPQPQLAQN